MHGLPVWNPSPPNLHGCPGSRETLARPALSREMRETMPVGVSDTLASATCGDLCGPLPGQRRRPPATGRGTGLVLLLSVVLQEPVRTTQTGQRRCREVSSMVPDLRTSSRSATRGTTSLDFPGCAKSPSLNPEAEVCKVGFVSAATSRTLLSDINAHTVMPSMKTARTERIAWPP